MNKLETLYKEWQSLQPLKEQDQNRLDQKFMLEFNYNSNHIEGNTLTYGQTELLLLFGRVVGEAKMKDLEEMKAHNVCLKMTIAEAEGKLTTVELAALFHYRYIRIHPFEDGNGRIARLLMNFILLRHGYPMIVIRSKNKKTYLEALGKADKNVGPVPSDGANATLEQASDFVSYITKQVESTLETDLDFLREKADSVWWFDGEFVKFKNKKTITILKAMISNPKITTKLLMDLIGVSATYIQKQITDLQKKQYIVRVGGRKNGEWKVNLIQTYGKSDL